MMGTKLVRNLLMYPVIPIGLIILCLLAVSSPTFAQDDNGYLRQVRVIDTNDLGLLNPAGLAYSLDANLFFVLEANTTTQASIATMTPFEELVDRLSIDVSKIDPINMAFDDQANRLLLFDSGSGELLAIRTGPDGYLDPSPEAITRFQIAQLGLQRPRGMTIDPTNGHLFILDSAALKIVRIQPDAQGRFDGATALSQGRVSWIDLTQAGPADPRGLAFNPDNGHLYLLSAVEQQMYELTETGSGVALHQLSDFELVDPQGLVFAPSGDATDAPSIINLYIADTGLEGYDTVQGLGRIMELSPQIIYVPGHASTIQAAIDLASDGDLVLVAPGVYRENIQLSGKAITLASYFHTSQDASYIEQTIIDGDGRAAITVNSSVEPGTKIIGFTIQNGQDGIVAAAKLQVLNNRFTHNGDAIDYESGGGICRNNVFENNRDDAIDLDGSTEVTIEGNIMRNNGDDGIEARLHSYVGPTLTITIRNNTITGSGEDGIQLIDYPDVSDRVFLVERNVIQGSAKVGVGLMDNGESLEDFRAASIPERIYLFNNTFVDNDHGLTGGDNLIALNNIFVGSTNIAVKNMDGNSIAAYNLFWENGMDHQDSNLDMAHMILEDPLLDVNYRPMPGSPAIDSGTAFFTWNSEVVLDLQPGVYCGVAPDLGGYETCWLFLPIILK